MHDYIKKLTLQGRRKESTDTALLSRVQNLIATQSSIRKKLQFEPATVPEQRYARNAPAKDTYYY